MKLVEYNVRVPWANGDGGWCSRLTSDCEPGTDEYAAEAFERMMDGGFSVIEAIRFLPLKIDFIERGRWES